MNKVKANISKETQDAALKVAKATQKPGQTKEQTRLIAQGIEKGIAEYKKQQKIKSREKDKAKKQQQKNKLPTIEQTDIPATQTPNTSNKLPWILLLLSWIGFATVYISIH